MEKGKRGPRLIPDEQPLDLFVTVTDLAGHPELLSLNSPPRVMETEHRLVISFSGYGDQARPLGDIPGLLFAARATSSFPGAFQIGRAHVELQSLMRISYAVFCLKKKNYPHTQVHTIYFNV